MRGLRAAAFLIFDKIRQRHRLAKFLSAVAEVGFDQN
jgi:hypothetical protein